MTWYRTIINIKHPNFNYRLGISRLQIGSCCIVNGIRGNTQTTTTIMLQLNFYLNRKQRAKAIINKIIDTRSTDL